MRTKSFLRPALLVSGLLVSGYGYGQVSIDNNFPSTGDYVGCDVSITDPLEIRHNGNQQIQWYTDALHRMGLYPNVNNTINGYTINQTGYFGLSDQPAFFTGSGPFSKIHLVEAMGSTNPVNYAQVLGFRDWMRNGIKFTKNGDHAYIGQKYNANEQTNLVFQWSDKERLRRPRSIA